MRRRQPHHFSSKHMNRRSFVAVLVVAFGTHFSVSAQQYPNRPIRLVVPFAAGGSADLIARAVNQQFSTALGQPVVIDNRPGAGGALGANLVAQAEPDGYTLLLSATGPNAIAPSLQKSLPYDPIRSFAPISRISIQPAIIVVNAKVEANTLREFIDLAKASPGKLNFASPGIGTSSHLGGELFKMQANVQMEHVPYKDGPLALADLLNGRIDVMFDNVGQFLPNLKTGKLRALAVASAQRASSLPDLPTSGEAGLPKYDYSIWFGLSAPAKTPAQILALLNARLAEALRTPAVVERMTALNAEVSGTTPAEFERFISAENEKWGKVIGAAGISPR